MDIASKLVSLSLKSGWPCQSDILAGVNFSKGLY